MSENNMTSLVWTRGYINYLNMVKLLVGGDGSCFFAGVLLAQSQGYTDGYIIDEHGKKHLKDRKELVRGVRHELALKLEEHRKDQNGEDILWYDYISRGNLRKFAETLPEYSLENMQKELRDGGAVDNVYVELVSEVIKINIFILDKNTQDVYVIGNDIDLLYKSNRNSVVLLYNGSDHFDAVGIKSIRSDNVYTLFGSNHSYIQYIIKR